MARVCENAAEEQSAEFLAATPISPPSAGFTLICNPKNQRPADKNLHELFENFGEKANSGETGSRSCFDGLKIKINQSKINALSGRDFCPGFIF